MILDELYGVIQFEVRGENCASYAEKKCTVGNQVVNKACIKLWRVCLYFFFLYNLLRLWLLLLHFHSIYVSAINQ